MFCFFFNDTATTEIYTLSLHDALLISEKQKWAKEFVLVYDMDGPDGRPERVTGQYGIYDTRPGDEGYSPIWRYHFVVVPRDYEVNSIQIGRASCRERV